MGLVAFLKRLFGGESPADDDPYVDPHRVRPREAASESSTPEKPTARKPSTGWSTPAAKSDSNTGGWDGPPQKHPLPALRYESSLVRNDQQSEVVSGSLPYEFARFGPGYGTFLDLSRDSDPDWLDEFGLPHLRTPQELADWFGLPLGRVAWLTGRTFPKHSPPTAAKGHYVYKWIPKRKRGYRLIEEPKPQLKEVQSKILREILDRVPPHRAAHGFRSGHSIISNAKRHTGAAILLKQDLENFYPSVGYRRVVAIFRTVGFSREVAIWLARLCTSRTPWDARELLGRDQRTGSGVENYTGAHLPQGAPTSPALANLSAFSLDVRLSGLSRAFDVTYTRYADDLTFSGGPGLIPMLRTFIPLSERIIRDERFRVHHKKRRVIRSHQRMTVTGVVVNEKPNLARDEYDRLKAILTNCVRNGPTSQNRGGVTDFEAHLRGRIAFASQCNAARGQKLKAIFDRINW